MATWNLKKSDLTLVTRLADEFKCPEIIARVLASHNVKSLATSKTFFDPLLIDLYSPFLMKDMKKATNLLQKNLESKKRIFILGDYDVDGTTGSAALYLFISSIGGDARIYIPNRITEGYGISKTGIDSAIEWGADLLISCDCGINAVSEIAYAKAQALSVIITDHHIPDNYLPDADAILNPNRLDCNYPFKGLCGGAVVLKLMQAVAEVMHLDNELVYNHLDLITLGTSADFVPLIDENRIIVKQGLSKLARTTKPGLRALLEVSGLGEKTLSIGRLLFNLAPRIKAAGRLGDANRAVQLLTTKSPLEAQKLASELNNENRKRQKIQKSTINDAMKKITAEVDLINDRAIILWDDNWHEDVIGIIASKVKEIYHRPVVVISLAKGLGKGSGRSILGFDLFENLKACKDLLEGYGGHPMAAGLSINRHKLQEFKMRFMNLASQKFESCDLVNSLDIEGELDLNLINNRFMNFLEKLAPFGPDHRTPKFITRNVNPVGNPKLVGGEDKHLKFRVKHGTASFGAIGFNKGKHFDKLINGKSIDIAYVVEKNEWQGNTSIQLNIKDIKQN